jgi:PAS domain S-box-containing protein
LAGNLIFDFFHGTKLLPTVCFCFANTTEAVSGATLIRWLVAERPTMKTLREVVGLMIFAGIFCPMLGALIGAATLVHFGLSPSFELSWKVWWGSTSMAVALLAPLLLIWLSGSGGRLRYLDSRKKKVELAVLFCFMTFFVVWLLVCDRGIMSGSRAFAVPLLVWAGLRFGPRIVVVASLFMALPLAFFTTQYSVGLTPEQAASGSYVFGLQLYLAMANLVGLVPAVVLDERNRALAKLRDSEESLRATIENTPNVAVQWYDRQARITYWNPASETMYGWTAAEAVGKTLDELIFTREQAAEFLEALAAVEKTGKPVGPMEFPFHRRDGDTGGILSTLFKIQTPSGEARFVCMDVDLTRRQQAEALNRTQMAVLEMIASGQPMADTLDALLRLIETQEPDMLCSILLLDADGIHFRHGAGPSLPEEYLRAVDGSAIGPAAGSCGTSIYRREPVFVADIANDPLWKDYRQLALPYGLLACWSTPIFDSRQRLLGSFAIFRRQIGLPDERHQRLIGMATHTAAICIDRQLSEEARAIAVGREKRARIEYTLQLIAAQEAERKRIAGELHDSLGQNLLLIKNRAQMALRLPGAPVELQEHLGNIDLLVSACIAETRQISHDLHPPLLDHLGLTMALEAMIEKTGQASQIVFTRKLEKVDELFSAEAAMNFYRIVQESLNNILKHSGARHADIRLERDVHEVQLQVADDGVGFPADELLDDSPGLGLKNMAERVKILGGRLKVDSQPGRGTRINVTVPVVEKEA